jgi:hypothetical protein
VCMLLIAALALILNVLGLAPPPRSGADRTHPRPRYPDQDTVIRG